MEKGPAIGENPGILPSPGEGQGRQEDNMTPPLNLREGLLPDAEHIEWLERSGWSTFAELLLDVSGYIQKPLDPTIPPDDEVAQEEALEMASGSSAAAWQSQVLWNLELDELDHLVEPFKQDMQKYRRTVKAIVQSWRDSGLL